MFYMKYFLTSSKENVLTFVSFAIHYLKSNVLYEREMKLLYIHAFSAEWLAAHYIIKAYLMIVVGFFLDCFSEIIIIFFK